MDLRICIEAGGNGPATEEGKEDFNYGMCSGVSRDKITGVLDSSIRRIENRSGGTNKIDRGEIVVDNCKYYIEIFILHF